jgi:hypothetical protein
METERDRAGLTPRRTRARQRVGLSRVLGGSIGESWVAGNFPAEPIHIRKVATVTAPVRSMSLLQDLAPVFGNLGEQRIDFGRRPDVVRQREPAKARVC